jgi:hypothetical protein
MSGSGREPGETDSACVRPVGDVVEPLGRRATAGMGSARSGSEGLTDSDPPAEHPAGLTHGTRARTRRNDESRLFAAAGIDGAVQGLQGLLRKRLDPEPPVALAALAHLANHRSRGLGLIAALGAADPQGTFELAVLLQPLRRSFGEYLRRLGSPGIRPGSRPLLVGQQAFDQDAQRAEEGPQDEALNRFPALLAGNPAAQAGEECHPP